MAGARTASPRENEFTPALREGGVRRLDWLHDKTRLIGIEVEKHSNGHGTGELVFGRA